MLSSLVGSLTSGIIRLAITAATLLLVYFLILKPILQTTENVSKGFANDASVQKALESVNKTFDGEHLESVQRQIETQIRKITSDSGQSKSETRRSQRLLRCVQKSAGNVDRMQRCAERFAP